MTKPTTFADAIPAIVDLADKQYDLIHGDANTVIETDNGPVPSAAKAVADLQAEYAAQDVVEQSLAARDAAKDSANVATSAETSAVLAAASKGGYTSVSLGLAATVSGQSFTVSPGTDPSSSSDLYLNVGGTAQKLSSVLAFVPLAPESGYVAAWVDPVTGLAAMAIAVTGQVQFASVLLPESAVGYAALAPAVQSQLLASGNVGVGNLSSEVQGLIAVTLAPESGYVWALCDPVSGLCPVRLTVNGQLQVDNLLVGASSVSIASLAPDAQRRVVPHVTDVVEVRPDSCRFKYGTITTRTAADGTLWTPFPHLLTQTLRGVNGSGTALQFRRCAGLPIRGSRSIGTWSPGTVASINYKGNLSSSSTIPPATAGAVTGDYYRYTSTTSVTWGSNTLTLGDVVVFDGAAWQFQASPWPVGYSNYNARLEGDFAVVTVAGTFNGVAYAVNDRIVYLGLDSRSTTVYALWYKGNPTNGELFYKGEFDASAGAVPSATPLQGDFYQVSVAGVVSGIALAVGDYYVYDGGIWGQIPTAAITTVAAGGYIPGLACTVSASEWEVRRQDKQGGYATRAGVSVSVRHQSSMRRNTDAIVLRSDSMFNIPTVPALLAALITDRTIYDFTRPGALSQGVLSVLQNDILNGTDASAGAFNFIWHGQNNLPTSDSVADANAAQIRECSIRIAELLGARDKRFCFLSVLGQITMTFNGTRIVDANHEAMFAGTGFLYAIEQWYQTMFPTQWLSPRKILLSAAGAVQDVRVPGTGMTEAQTAALYGWVPYSFFNVLTARPFAIPDLSLKGYWSDAALPTGGSPLDAYTRSGGGTVGNLLVNVAGVWGEYAFDNTHLGPGATQGGPVIAAALQAYLAANYL